MQALKQRLKQLICGICPVAECPFFEKMAKMGRSSEWAGAHGADPRELSVLLGGEP